MQRGEWWIDDNGQTEYADGDVGDRNHESIAFYGALGLSPDELPEGLEDFSCCRVTADEAELLLENGAPEKAVAYFRGGNPDARLYAAKEMGWIRVVTREKSAEVQLWGLDDEKLKRLQGGEMWDDDPEFESPDAKVTIEDAKTGWMEEVPLGVLMKAPSAARLILAARGEGETHGGLDGKRRLPSAFAGLMGRRR